jgi:hypothetical protein
MKPSIFCPIGKAIHCTTPRISDRVCVAGIWSESILSGAGGGRGRNFCLRLFVVFRDVVLK